MGAALYATEEPAATLRVDCAPWWFDWKHLIWAELMFSTKPLFCQLSALRTYCQSPPPPALGNV